MGSRTTHWVYCPFTHVLSELRAGVLGHVASLTPALTTIHHHAEGATLHIMGALGDLLGYPTCPSRLSSLRMSPDGSLVPLALSISLCASLFLHASPGSYVFLTWLPPVLQQTLRGPRMVLLQTWHSAWQTLSLHEGHYNRLKHADSNDSHTEAIFFSKSQISVCHKAPRSCHLWRSKEQTPVLSSRRRTFQKLL